jgi:hypothetical protein
MIGLRAIPDEQQHIYAECLVVANRSARVTFTSSLILALPLEFIGGEKTVLVPMLVRRGALI